MSGLSTAASNALKDAENASSDFNNKCNTQITNATKAQAQANIPAVPTPPSPTNTNSPSGAIKISAVGDNGGDGHLIEVIIPLPPFVCCAFGTRGGRGGDGGSIHAGLVATSNLNINVTGEAGISAVSSGGRGGDGGGGGVGIYVSGGNGGNGGNGRSIAFSTDAQITANLAPAIIAVSSGGYGGDGGSTTLSGVSSPGDGGSGGRSGDVSVTNNGFLTTTGFNSYGIVARTLGGSGGDAGSTGAGLVGLGSSGGASRGALAAIACCHTRTCSR